MAFLLLALGLLAAAAVGALLLGRRAAAAGWTVTVAVAAASALALVPTVPALLGGEPLFVAAGWSVPGRRLALGLDPLTAWFLLPLLVLAPLGAAYGIAYLPHAAHGRSLGGTWAAYAMLVAAMVVVLAARHALLFLVAWEAMSLAAYLLVAFDHQEPAVRRSGWIFLVAAHAGTAALVAFFLLLGRAAGGLDLAAGPVAAAPPVAVLYLLALVGFGVKAGLVPLHVWLPGAHAAAPSHVSALLSAVMVKLGVYGLLRSALLIGPAPSWWSGLLGAAGLGGALLAITLAVREPDLKRVLAYSTVENVGLIAVGLAIGFAGRARGDVLLASLGFAAALLHVWNHALMKGCLFFASGSVVHATGTRTLSRLGGVLRRLPRTGPALLVGAVAIAGLPPLNGLSGKWMLYLGLLESGRGDGARGLPALFAIGLLALVGALALACFVRLAGIALLGAPRSAPAAGARESPWLMTGPALALAALCLMAALLPGPLIASLAAPLAQLGAGDGAGGTHAGAALVRLGAFNGATWLALLLMVATLRAALGRRPSGAAPTWDCGYAAPAARMQYTAAGFSELLLDGIAPRALRPAVVPPRPQGPLPGPAALEFEASDPLLERLFVPFFRRWADRFARLRWLQQGVLPLYLFYILAALVLALLWAALKGRVA